jgi:hypothetical protein
MCTRASDAIGLSERSHRRCTHHRQRARIVRAGLRGDEESVTRICVWQQRAARSARALASGIPSARPRRPERAASLSSSQVLVNTTGTLVATPAAVVTVKVTVLVEVPFSRHVRNRATR